MNDGTVGSGGTNRIDGIIIRGLAHPAREFTGPAGWRMLGAAKPGGTVADLASLSLVQGVSDEYPQAFAPNVYTHYDGENWQTPAALATDLESGRGFIWYLWENAFDPEEPDGESTSAGLPLVVALSGDAHDTDVTTTFTADERVGFLADDGFFLIGNPFADELDVDGVELASGSVGLLHDNFHHWNPDPAPGSYEILSATAGDRADVWDGFFAQVTGVVAESFPLTFEFDHGCVDGCPARPAGDWYRVALLLEGAMGEHGEHAAYDGAAMVVFASEATDAWDRFDGSKLYPLGSDWAVISPMGDRSGEQVAKAVESRPLPAGTVTVPVAVSTTAGGAFTISLGEATLVPEEWTIELEDTLTRQTVDLRSGSVSFSVDGNVWHVDRFRLHVADAPVSTDPNTTPYEFGLASAYPNPFSGSTTVSFTLPEAADVSLSVFDVLGRRVAILAEGECAAGPHAVTFDGGALAGGVYVVRLAAGANVETHRVTLVR